MSPNTVAVSPSWKLPMSKMAQKTANPGRLLAETSKVQPNPGKKLITLQMGDPTLFGNYERPQQVVDAIKKAVEKDKFSYRHTAGIVEARQAVADYVNKEGLKVTSDDVILTSGGSSSLEMCFITLADQGDNILIPRPCFNYQTWLLGYGIEPRFFNLDPKQGWEVDLDDLESKIDQKTRGILINNVGNPCGNVYSKKHILDILAIADRHQLPIIADDIYEHFVFPGVEYVSIASLSKNVPILSCSGLTKRFIMPGVRLGWIVLHDENNSLAEVRQGLARILGRNFGPNCTIQMALPEILSETPQEYFDDVVERVQHQALLAFNYVVDIPGLTPILPEGAFYMMIKIDLERFPKFANCLEFVEGLTEEQSILAFPGACFNFPGYLRFVLTLPEDMMIEACKRVQTFCSEHYVASKKAFASHHQQRVVSKINGFEKVFGRVI